MTDHHWRPQLPPGKLVSVPGRGRVLVRDLAGPPDAPVLVLLHGWTATADLNWYPSYTALAEHYRVVAFDHRGHGRGIRARQRFRLTDCADDAVAVADALGIDRFVPVGYSMGGPIASLVWRRHRSRVEGVVLCATACRFGQSRFVRAELALLGPLAASTRVMPRRTAAALYHRLVGSRTKKGNLQPWAIDEIRSCDPRHVLEAGFDLRHFDSSNWIHEVDVPTSVIVVDGDDIVPTSTQDDLARRIADATVVRIHGGHDVCVRHPRRFIEALRTACAAATQQRPSSDAVAS